MITKSDCGTIERVGVGTEQSFRIKASAKAFEILSSGLYSDKVKAILRELSCNAYDAHMLAGNTNPFLVHLPNTIEPFFSLRDFGVGLSHEDVVTVFTTYFESTKTGSNDFIGCLGLGSKSPFSYTEAFMVTSFFNGTKRIYNAFLNEYKVPTIVLMSEETTTDANGVEIQFPVQTKDFNEFIRKTPSVFEYFKIKPEIVGADVKHNKIEYFITRNKWGVRGSSSNDRDYSKARAVMGNVAYPISDYSEDNLTPTEKAVLSYDIDIFFDIGQLEVSASREKLSYNTATKANIKKMLEVVANEILEEVIAKVAATSNLWDARKMVYSLRKGEYSVFSTIVAHNENRLVWNGQPLFNALNNMGTEYVKLDDLDGCLAASRFVYQGYRRKVGQLNILNAFPVTDKLHVFIQDVSKNVLSRCNKYFIDVLNQDSTVHIILLKDLEAVDTVTGAKINAVDKLKEHLGMDPSTTFPLLSTLPYDAASYAGTVYNPKNACGVLLFNPDGVVVGGGRRTHTRKSYSDMWNKVDVDLDDGGIYVTIDHYQIDGRDPQEVVPQYLRLLEAVGVVDTTVFGIKPRSLDKVSSRKNWITLSKYVTEAVNNYLNIHKLNELYGFHQEIAKFKSNCSYENPDAFAWLTDHGEVLFIDHPEVKAVIDRLNAVHSKMNLFSNIIKHGSVIGLYNIDYDQNATQATVKAEFETAMDLIKNEYPLLPFIRLNSIRSDIESVRQYVNLMKANKQQKLVSIP